MAKLANKHREQPRGQRESAPALGPACNAEHALRAHTERSSEQQRDSPKDTEGRSHRHTQSRKASVQNYAPDHRGSAQKTPAGDVIARDGGLALVYARLNHIRDTPTTKVDIN